MSNDATKVETTLLNMSKLLKRVAEDSVFIKKAGSLENLAKELPPIEYAKLCSSVGYNINCLYKGKRSLLQHT